VKVGLHTRLKAGAEEPYDQYHAAVWPEILDGIRRAGVSQWVIFRDGLDLFHYIECEDYDRAMAELARSEVDRRWQAEMAPMMEVAHDLSGTGGDKLKRIFEL
jgi:L-rhamnose mutarotase